MRQANICGALCFALMCSMRPQQPPSHSMGPQSSSRMPFPFFQLMQIQTSSLKIHM